MVATTNLLLSNDYLSFLKRVGFPARFTAVLKGEAHPGWDWAGWEGLVSLTCRDESGQLYDVDVRYAWGSEIFEQNLVDHNGVALQAFQETRRDRDRRIRSKLVLYLCEPSTGLKERKKSDTVPEHLILGRYWQAIHHTYLLMPLAHPFTVPVRKEDISHTGFSTTRSVIRMPEPLIGDNNNREQKRQQRRIFLPPHPMRKGEGGLRTKGIVKARYDKVPLISVITVVLNGEKYLEQAIQSVINQPYENIEYIILDGGSSDGTVDIIRKYEERINYWVSEPDHGIYTAMNKGWTVSQGDYIYYLGADDVLLDLPFKILEKAFTHNVKMVYGDVFLSNGRYFKSQYGMRLLFNNTLHHQGLFLNKSISDTPPFNEQYKLFSDFDFNQRIYKQREEALATHRPIAFFRLTRERKGSRSGEFFRIIKNNFGFPTMLLAHIFLKLRGLAFRLRGWTH